MFTCAFDRFVMMNDEETESVCVCVCVCVPLSLSPPYSLLCVWLCCVSCVSVIRVLYYLYTTTCM